LIDYLANGDSFSPAKPRLWLEKPVAAGNRRRFFDLAEDGKHILTFARPDADRNRRVTFLFNFFDEVRRRLPESAIIAAAFYLPTDNRSAKIDGSPAS